MAKIAFILLSHKDPDAVIAQAHALTSAGDCMAIHFDATAGQANFERIRSALADNPRVTFARKRVRCGWGEWSLVQATLLAIEAALDAFPDASHLYMVSGDCMAIKSAAFVRNYLDENDKDFIESHDFFASDWIKTGMKDERLIHHHWFNERTNKRLFYAAHWLQDRLNLKRTIPDDLQVMIGSQWWCLRRRSIEAILEFVRSRRDITRFFRTTWIPDETFFQTLTRHLIPSAEIENRTLTFLMFTDYGMPATFMNDHYDLLLSQDYLFARKISPQADALRERLARLYTSGAAKTPTSGEGRAVFQFVTSQGRVGRRFGRRFWEAEGSLGRNRTINVVTCKKWHVAKRLVERIDAACPVQCFEYIFDEGGAPLPDLGGIEQPLQKRTRHRRALLSLLLSHHGTDQMVFCVDPANIDVLRDLAGDEATVRLLEIDCQFSDDYLHGHVERVGLAGPTSSDATIAQLLPAIRRRFDFEQEQICALPLNNHTRLRETDAAEPRLRALADFLQVDATTAGDILDIGYLFED